MFTTAHKNKATMDLLYNDILTLGKIFGKRNDALSLVSGWQKRPGVNCRSQRQVPVL
ncbi:iron (III) ABC transporter periplasmic binding protein [Klebsiella pneumoniae]|uniref:Iron (III) ABC transporter periplasmic binding protein n=1 Tax=Klebsiella pneumoniae TaxID=573 RepID=A0A2X3C1L3_KLEPN|nr:iron (III) ABC transporter periplasmic binding protein [Klebsiella pneumoniae]